VKWRLAGSDPAPDLPYTPARRRFAKQDCSAEIADSFWGTNETPRVSIHAAAAAIIISLIAPVSAQHLFHGASGLLHGVPDFCGQAANVSVADGAWSDPAIWSLGHVPTDGEQVAVASRVAYDVHADTPLDCLDVRGTLTFATDKPTRLKVTTIVVKPEGTLEIGTDTAPATAEVIFRDTPLNTTTDPEQYGNGLIAFGRVRVGGYSRLPTFVRLAAEPLAGATKLTLTEAPTTWRVGDVLVIPDTRQLFYTQTDLVSPYTYSPQWEEVAIAAIDGKTVTLAAGLKFDHKGARNTVTGVIDFRPHVMNVTRSIVIRSENPAGTRGHTLYSQRADVDIQGAEFRGLGRTTVKVLDSTTFDATGKVTKVGTNQIGRYALHMHHAFGPANPQGRPSFTVIGNSFTGGTLTHKWPITLHNSHYGLVEDNVMFKFGGAGVMTEDGSESFNVIRRNIAVAANGTGGRLGEGREGSGFWFRGSNNYVTDNVAADIRSDGWDSAYGFKYSLYYVGNVRIPKFQGADTTVNANVTVTDGNAMPILEFARNEVYGATESGMTYWWICAADTLIKPNCGESVIKDLKVWNVHNKAIFHYPASNIRIDGLIVRSSNPGGWSACCQDGVYFGDYVTHKWTLENSDIDGRINALGGSPRSVSATDPTVTVRNTRLAAQRGIAFELHWSVSADLTIFKPRLTILDHVRFQRVPALPSLTTITGGFGTKCCRNLVMKDEYRVIAYNGAEGLDFEWFRPEQSPTFIVPKSTAGQFIGSPEAGLTNQQNWDKYQIAIGGKVAPCNATRPNMSGFACPKVTATPPPKPAIISVTEGSR
jgi:hypothetical protein